MTDVEVSQWATRDFREMVNEKEMESAPEKQGYMGYAFQAPRSLSIEEKKYLLSVERGDLNSVKRILQAAGKSMDKQIDANCVDSLGRGALTLAIESENLEMLELLVVMGVETKDALLHAINQEFVEAVELLLEHEELLRNLEIEASGGNCEDIVHSWQKVDPSLARYPPDMTPLILAAQKNNYEILKLLLDRGATLPMPHAIKCDCNDCVLQATTGDPLRLSSTRISEYRALASPSLIALSSPDPLMTAFKMSWDLRELSIAEPESRSEYLKLRQQVENFAVDLLQQTRSSSELNTILNYDPDDHSAKSTKRLARLEQAIQYKQKKFVAHPHVQQLLAAIWYEGVPGFRRMSTVKRFWILIKTALLFPFYCLIYFFLPNSRIGQTMRRPFMKFLVHASSYLFFLLVLILVSQRFEEDIVGWFGSEYEKNQIEEASMQRGRGPSFLECIVIIYVLGFIWEEAREVYVDGLRAYLRDLWNFIDFTRNMLYVTTGILRLAAYIQQQAEISNNDPAAKSLREDWSDFDPQLIAEGLFAAANIFSALKLVHLFSINPHLGPLQISLGRMVIDIVKFFFIYTLVLFAFACGLNQLLWYFAELERQECYRDRYKDSWDPTSANCDRWRRFSSLFESCQSLFWASFGSVGIDSFELTGIKSYTRFWGLLMFGSYSVINVIVLLNLLIAMMSNSYSIIEEHSDTEWKFARTKLWMSYFEEGGTLPPPFNIFPHPKLCLRMCGLQRKSEGKGRNIRRIACEHRYYGSVMKALIWRYVVNAHSEHEMEPVTEDDIHELKNDFSSWRCELLDILKRNGMDTGGADTSDRTVLGKKMRVWERRLMKDFQLSSLADDPAAEMNILQTVPDNEDIAAKWRRIARLAVLKSAEHRWTQVIDGTVKKSQIGRSNNRTSLKRQAKLKHVMEEARRLSLKSPPPLLSPIRLPDPVNPATILRVLNDDEDFGPSSRGVSPARSVTPEPTSIVNHAKVIDPASVNYEDERFQNKSAPRPLMPLRTSPPRVVKRKSQAPAPGAAVPRPRSPCQQNRSNPNILSVENLEKNRGDTSIVRPRPRSPRIPEVTIIPVTPEARSKNCEGYSRFLKIEPKSPKVSPAKKSPRKGGGWL